MSKVLIVDDSATNLILLKKMVEGLGPSVVATTVSDGEQALNWLDQNDADLIIADYQMPGMNGVTFTRRCRTLLNCQDVPIVMVTAARRRKVCLAALKAGATDFLNSPVDETEFRDRIGMLLKVRRANVEAQARFPDILRTPTIAKANSSLLPDKLGLERVLDATPVMLSAFDREGCCLFVNAMQASMIGASPDALTGSDITDFPEGAREYFHQQRDAEIFGQGQRTLEFEHELTDRHGIRRYLLTTKSPLFDEKGDVSAVLTTSIDTTGRKRAEENLLYVAEHDSLTELPNRLSLRNHIATCVDPVNPDADGISLLFIDIDRFKDINDALGHEAGDQLLIKVASRIDASLRADDFVARIGGDEFAVVLDGVKDIDVAHRRAKDICETIAKPVEISQHNLRVTASIGIALYPTDADNLDDLLVKADLAMYRAKETGGNTFRAHTAGDFEKARLKASLECELRDGLEANQFELHYQPKVRLSDGKVIGAEALIRWQHPRRGLLSPAQFLPIAEESGLIVELGTWIMRRACRDAVHWRRRLGAAISVAVNVSPVQFARQDVAELVREALDFSGLPPEALIIELTEQTMLGSEASLGNCLEKLRVKGCGLSLDDFGTGFASLNCLQAFPIHEIKIDRSFVRHMSTRTNDAVIVDTICALGQSLGLSVTAEGVETSAQAEALKDFGCNAAQGYHFARPQPFDAFIASAERLCEPQQPVEESCA